MAKKSIREIRREALSQAALDALIQYGIRGTTLDRVAKLAGVTKGIVLHYYGDKDALFEGVQRKAYSLLRDCVSELLHQADTPEERLYAVLVGNFASPVFHQQICHAWINLCADVPHNTQSQRIQTVVHARIRSNLISALKDMIPADDVQRTATQITALIDGVWLRASLQIDPMSGDDGLDLVDQAVMLLLKTDDAANDRFKVARRKIEHVADIILNSKAFREKSMVR